MFPVRDGGVIEPVPLSAALEANGLGTGAAVADIDNDGVLDLLVAHGESAPQPLSLSALISKTSVVISELPRLHVMARPVVTVF